MPGIIFQRRAAENRQFLVDVDLTNYAWLRFDWNNDASYSNDTALPSARYTFGTYRGNDRTLFWQDSSVP